MAQCVTGAVKLRAGQVRTLSESDLQLYSGEKLEEEEVKGMASWLYSPCIKMAGTQWEMFKKSLFQPREQKFYLYTKSMR